MNIQLIKSKIRKFILGYDVPTYYFSQGGEDAILQHLFHKKLSNKKKGFFVDIGAYHPHHHSNTFFFYLNGWSGINIDPSPGSMILFNKTRPRDINLEIGISDKNESLTYYLIDEKSTMNSFSKDNLIQNGMIKHVKKEIPIKVKPLSEILDTYSNKFENIDFISIDVEGFDLNVLKSNDWKRYKPSVIAIELTCNTLEDVEKSESTIYLKSLGYITVAKNLILKDVATVFFVSSDFDY